VEHGKREFQTSKSLGFILGRANPIELSWTLWNTRYCFSQCKGIHYKWQGNMIYAKEPPTFLTNACNERFGQWINVLEKPLIRTIPDKYLGTGLFLLRLEGSFPSPQMVKRFIHRGFNYSQISNKKQNLGMRFGTVKRDSLAKSRAKVMPKPRRLPLYKN